MTITTGPNPPTSPVIGDVWINPQGVAIMWNGVSWTPTTNPANYPTITPRGYIGHSYPRKDGNSYG